MNIQIASSETMQVVGMPLVVDVDGTLVATDLLHEAALQFIARHPFQTFRILGWLIAGKAHLKAQLADRVTPGIETVPLRQEVYRLYATPKQRDARYILRPHQTAVTLRAWPNASAASPAASQQMMGQTSRAKSKRIDSSRIRRERV